MESVASKSSFKIRDNSNSNGTVEIILHTPSACLDAVAKLSAINPTSSTPPAFTLEYLAEGNANVIYNLHPTNGNINDTPSILSQHAHCAVLRLRKDLAFTKPAIEVLSAFRTKIQPLFIPEFKDLLMEQALFKMERQTVDEVNSTLKSMETDSGPVAKSRPSARRGVYHPSFEKESYGILMPNLLSLGPTHETSAETQNGDGFEENKTKLLEFKAKWLLQSPSAPSAAVRCRTCAVNTLRRLKDVEKENGAATDTTEKKQKHRGRGDGGFCPFAILSEDPSILQAALEIMGLFGSHRAMEGATTLQNDFIAKVQPVLRHLQTLQGKYNEVGLRDFQDASTERASNATPSHESDFSVAMALRDCSIFLIVAEKGERTCIEAVKIADLDLKTTGGGKLGRWAGIEEELIEKGMYTKGQTELEAADIVEDVCVWKKVTQR
jgi:inositol-pentakisphosphate 2-kinase